MRYREFLKDLKKEQRFVLKHQYNDLKKLKPRWDKDSFSVNLRSTINGVDFGLFKCTVYTKIKDLDYYLFFELKEGGFPNSDYKHPHIGEECYACLGEFNQYIMENIEIGDYLMAINYIQKFLNQDTDNGFVSSKDIIEWQDYCHCCGELENECICGTI